MSEIWDDYFIDSGRLKELVKKHPDWPVVFLAGKFASDGDHDLTFCTDVRITEGQVLAAEVPCTDDITYISESDFRADMDDWLGNNWREITGRTDEPYNASPDEYDRYLDAEVAKYADKWKDCILICVDN